MTHCLFSASVWDLRDGAWMVTYTADTVMQNSALIYNGTLITLSDGACACCTTQVVLEEGVRMEPYSAAQPGSRVEAGGQLKALRKARSKLVAEKKDPLAMMKALGAQAAAAKAKAAGGTGGIAARDLYKCAPVALCPVTPELRAAAQAVALLACATCWWCASSNGCVQLVCQWGGSITCVQ